MREAVLQTDLSLLTYNITSNHVHLLACANEFRSHLEHSLHERLTKDQMQRQAKWTQSLAVGSAGFVETIEANLSYQQRTEVVSEAGVWDCERAMNQFSRPKAFPYKVLGA